MIKFSDINKFTVTVAAGASIHHDEDNLEVSFHQIEMEARYSACSTEPEHGINRPDFYDEITLSFFDDSVALLISEAGLSAIKLQCMDHFRGEIRKVAGDNSLTFG